MVDTEFLKSLIPWLVIIAIGAYCALQAYLNIRARKWALATAGVLSAAVLLGLDLIMSGSILRGSY